MNSLKKFQVKMKKEINLRFVASTMYIIALIEAALCNVHHACQVT